MNRELYKRILSSLILTPIVLFFLIKGSNFFIFFILIMLIITFYEWHYLSFKKIYYLPGFIFIIFSFYTFYYFRNEETLTFFLLILLTCVATDIGGYVFGKILKGPKLSNVSPNKTYAGVLGSFVLSILFASIFLKNLTFLSLAESDQEIEIKIFFIILSISLISQAGDLLISFAKDNQRLKIQAKLFQAMEEY